MYVYLRARVRGGSKNINIGNQFDQILHDQLEHLSRVCDSPPGWTCGHGDFKREKGLNHWLFNTNPRTHTHVHSGINREVQPR